MDEPSQLNDEHKQLIRRAAKSFPEECVPELYEWVQNMMRGEPANEDFKSWLRDNQDAMQVVAQLVSTLDSYAAMRRTN